MNLLMRGVERFESRDRIASTARQVLAAWENSMLAE